MPGSHECITWEQWRGVASVSVWGERDFSIKRRRKSQTVFGAKTGTEDSDPSTSPVAAQGAGGRQ